MWVHGPFPAGSYSDVRIFRLGMKNHLNSGEKVLGDLGYQGDGRCVTPANDQSDEIRRVRARHETANRRTKQFCITSSVFRHNISLHSQCFHATCNLAQLMIESGEPLFH